MEWLGNKIDLGMTSQCWFHTGGLIELKFRLFQLNSVEDINSISNRDYGETKVSFRIRKSDVKEIFISLK